MMVATEFHSYQEAQDPFEAEETLSLSDLPITGDSAQCDFESYSKKMTNAGFDDDDDDDFFEFFSEDFTASTRSVEKDIIFCGKIINTCYSESLNDVAKQSNKVLHQKGTRMEGFEEFEVRLFRREGFADEVGDDEEQVVLVYVWNGVADEVADGNGVERHQEQAEPAAEPGAGGRGSGGEQEQGEELVVGEDIEVVGFRVPK
ncbi:uncharacterized protein G2W53_025554 [Senna tora]|uniref:Uncharacterized protein n=1 Tax=Senna tora TaxID=362788 RepID=A0A834WKD6_9FABA|nr:uncharacterized protein G2W53_025554 [Senna tora]